MRHLVLYDGECGVCDTVVRWVLRADTAELFAFAPLQGQTAQALLPPLLADIHDIDSVILIEDFQSSHPKLFIHGKAVFRICWQLGGWWLMLGWLSFLPEWLYDWAYRLFAKRRYQFVSKRCLLPTAAERKRFLP
jgi:predicted DCC family thiol-disulfide oxidoreductase YuxK